MAGVGGGVAGEVRRVSGVGHNILAWGRGAGAGGGAGAGQGRGGAGGLTGA